MGSRLSLEIQAQPDETTCGPTCLQAVYGWFGDRVPLEQVIAETQSLKGGGTLAVLLGNHALRRGYRATLYTYNLQVFDPTWFQGGETDLAERLRAQAAAKGKRRLEIATRAYLEFLERGGAIRFEDLTTGLLRRHLKRGVPILTGLSATYLYRTAREAPPEFHYDDVRGEPAGHFVVLCGYDSEKRQVRVADPYQANPYSPDRQYDVAIERAVCAILLGVLTYDANLLVLEPRRRRA